jgi:5-methylcytosine-specific restriction endonuclease McrA
VSTARHPKFFAPLKRRAAYSKKADGSFYSYRYYREHFQIEIVEDCAQRCVYCDSHEDEAGGREAMQLDHFRPYTRTGFENLENDPCNFHHACGRCNLLKSDKWPSTHATQPHDGIVGFIDPFTDDRSRYLVVNADGEIVPKIGPAPYLIRVLALNRRLLKLQRQQRIFRMLLNDYEAKNHSRWEAAACGNASEKELQEVAIEFAEYRRLRQLSSPNFKE